jgi:hypothetical protein
MFRRQCGDQHLIRTEEKIGKGQAPPVGDPALRQVVGPIVHKMAALTERAEVRQPVVRRVAIEMCRCKHDTGHAKLGGLHKVGPPGHAPLVILPGRRLLIEPPPIRQAADEGEVWSPTPLAPTSGTLEANTAAQLAPVWRIERPQFATYGHGYAVFFPSTR